MCGIVGGTAYDEEGVAEAMVRIGHRGRDASATVRLAGVGPRGRDLWLGHRRLAIQGPGAAADQPFAFGDCLMTYNGELWRNCLAALPAPPGAPPGDTAVVAASYAAGADDLAAWAAGLEGMFALAVYDPRRRRVVLARDRAGRAPLHWRRRGRAWAFASERKALPPPGGMLFPAGAVAAISLDDGRTDLTYYHDWRRHRRPVAEVDAEDRGADYYAAELRRLLEAAVLNETVADVPICTILSGGVDSTIVTAILARQYPSLRAYTVSVGDSDGRDDLHWARRAAEAIGVPLTEVVMSREDAEAGLLEAVWAVEDDRWVQVAPAIPQIAMAHRIGADGYKVVFGGEGADELFASYGDARRWSWRPQQYHDRRVSLVANLHDNNLIRGNKAMMWGGTVELRTPFLDHALVDFCLRIPTRYRDDRGGAGKVVKPLLRAAFRGELPDDLLMRPKVAFQDGAHSDFLKNRRGEIARVYRELFA